MKCYFQFTINYIEQLKIDLIGNYSCLLKNRYLVLSKTGQFSTSFVKRVDGSSLNVQSHTSNLGLNTKSSGHVSIQTEWSDIQRRYFLGSVGCGIRWPSFLNKHGVEPRMFSMSSTNKKCD